VNRRGSIAALLGLVAAAATGAGRAQPRVGDREKTLGLLWVAPLREVAPFQVRLLDRLKTTGWVEPQSLAVVSVSADGQVERLRAEAEALVGRRVDVLWTGTPEATVAAARATGTLPIVFANVGWPVETGVIESFARPGRNLTGVSSYVGLEVGAKRLEFLREIVPGARRLSWIQAPTIQATVAGGHFDILPELDAMMERLGFETRHHLVRGPADLDDAFGAITAWGAQALAVANSAQIYVARRRIAEFAIRNRLPSAFLAGDYVEAGGLLSYGADFTSNVQRSADYIDRILRGARPQDLPVERPDRYELVVNLGTAKSLGLAIPPLILLRADRVIG